MQPRDEQQGIVSLKREAFRDGFRRKRTEEIFMANRQRMLHQASQLSAFKSLLQCNVVHFIERLEDEEEGELDPLLYSDEELRNLGNLIADSNQHLSTLTKLIGLLCQRFPAFYDRFLASNLHIALIDRCLDNREAGSELLHLLALFLHNGYTNEVFLEKVARIINIVDGCPALNYPIHGYTVLIHKYANIVQDEDLVGLLSNLSMVHLDVYMNYPVKRELIKTHQGLLHAISITFSAQATTILKYPRIIGFVSHLAFNIVDELLSRTAMNVIARFLAGDEDQTYEVLYAVEQGELMLEQQLLRMIEQDSFNTVRREAALALSNLFATNSDLITSFQERGSVFRLLRAIERETCYNIQVQLLLCLRNFIYCSTYETCEETLQLGINQILIDNFDAMSDDKVSVILEAFTYLYMKEECAKTFEIEYNLHHYPSHVRLRQILVNRYSSSQNPQEIEMIKQLFEFCK